MANWQAWVAAAGGLVALAGEYGAMSWAVYLGAAVALVFGVWAAYAK